jgi:hypothetical protein
MWQQSEFSLADRATVSKGTFAANQDEDLMPHREAIL